MMRVTERSRIAAVMLAQSRASTRLDRAMRVASGGQRVTKPSDDPAAYGAMVRSKVALAMLEEQSKNAARVMGELEVAQNALSSAVDVIARAQATALTGATSTTDAASRKLLAAEVRTMRDELLSLANARYGDRYLFGGTRTDAAPFDPVTGAFLGNDQVVRVPVMHGVAPPSNVSGARAFTAAGGVDVFASLAELADALEADDVDRIRAALGPLRAAHEQVVRAQVESGLSTTRFRDALDVMTSTKTAIAERLSEEIDGDPASQLTELALARTAYERTIAVSRQLLAVTSPTSG
jgi:flagellar hook-associated protein 3 FlgL